jgi:hypothetical protein
LEQNNVRCPLELFLRNGEAQWKGQNAEQNFRTWSLKLSENLSHIHTEKERERERERERELAEMWIAVGRI